MRSREGSRCSGSESPSVIIEQLRDLIRQPFLVVEPVLAEERLDLRAGDPLVPGPVRPAASRLAEVAVADAEPAPEVRVLRDPIIEALQPADDAIAQCGIRPERRELPRKGWLSKPGRHIEENESAPQSV